jgi:hypothetical protein
MSIPPAIKPIMLHALDSEEIERLVRSGEPFSIRKTHKSAVMRELAVPEESRQHRQRVIGEGLIDKRLLPLKRFNGTARLEGCPYCREEA